MESKLKKKMYKIGRRFEYYIKHKFKKQGALVIRSAGSHSPFDLIAIMPEGIWFIQCKRAKKISLKKLKENLKEIKEKYFPTIDKIYIAIAYSQNRKVHIEKII